MNDEDKKHAELAQKCAMAVAIITHAASQKVPNGAPKITLITAAAMGAVVGLETMVFRKHPETTLEQDDFSLYTCLLMTHVARSAYTKETGVAMDMGFEP